MDINKEIQEINKLQIKLMQDIKDYKVSTNKDIDTLNSLISRFNKTVWRLRKIVYLNRKEQ